MQRPQKAAVTVLVLLGFLLKLPFLALWLFHVTCWTESRRKFYFNLLKGEEIII